MTILDTNECENDKQCPGIGEWCVNLIGGFICCNKDSTQTACNLNKKHYSGILISEPNLTKIDVKGSPRLNVPLSFLSVNYKQKTLNYRPNLTI